MTLRPLRSLLAGTALAAVVAVGAVTPAAAEESAPAPEPIASAQGWDVGVGNVGASVEVTGAVGWLLRPLVNDILNGVLAPVTALVNGLPNAIVNPVLGAVAGFDLRASTPRADAPRAAAPFDLGAASPTPATLDSCDFDESTCYRSGLGEVSEIDVLLAGLLDLDIAVIHGLTELVETAETHDSFDIVSQASVAGLGLTLLGIPLLDLDAVTSTAQCTVVGSAPNAATTQVAGLGLAGGLVEVAVAEETGALEVTVGGTPLGVEELPIGLGVGNGLLTDVVLDGDLLRVSIGLGVEQLLDSLGAADSLIQRLLGLLADPTAQAALVIEVAAGSDVDGTSAAAHGLRVGVGLHLDLSLTLLGLIGASLSVAGSQADVAGNLLQLDLAQARCASTAMPGSENTWIPSGVT